MPGTNYVSAINVHMCRSVVPGRAGGHIPGRSAAYENQALLSLALRWLCALAQSVVLLVIAVLDVSVVDLLFAVTVFRSECFGHCGPWL